MSKRKKRVPEYHTGKIRELIERVAKYAAEHPEEIKEQIELGHFGKLHHIIEKHIPEYGDKSKCFNCARSMEIALYTAGISEALLLLEMAKAVRHELTKLPADDPRSFTSANLVHIPTLPTTDAIRHAITRASYLGLVKQPEDKKMSGYWLITHWGWKLLRGESIPRSVKYWEGHLIGRSQETTNLAQMFQTHRDQIQKAIARRKEIKTDHRAAIGEWDPIEWRGFGGYIDDVAEPAAPQPTLS